MKIFLFPLIIVLISCLLFLVSGCAEGPTDPESGLALDSNLSPADHTDGSKEVENNEAISGVPELTVTEVGKTFIFSLESNPTTGYSWQAEFDLEYLELINKEFVIDSKAIGAPGVEKYEFLALKQGQTEVTMIYKRPWESDFIDKQICPVKITP